MGTLLREMPGLGTVVFWVRGLAQLSAEVSDLIVGGVKKNKVRDIGILFYSAEDVCPWLLSICNFPLHF